MKKASSRSRKLLWIGLSVVAVVLTPVVVHEGLRRQHARDFHGMCGPHATDIPARPCSYEAYMAEFGAGFAGVGLLLIEGAAFVGAATVVSLAWALAARRLRARDAGSGRRTDSATMEVSATPEAVYAAFAHPAALMQWLPPGTMTGRALEYDFRQGGRYRIALTYDDAAPSTVGKTTERTDVSTGHFLSLEPGRRIVQSVEFESADAALAGEMTMTWSFEVTPSGTRVTITAENVPSAISKVDHDEGLRSSLENLAKYVQNATTE